MSPLRIRPLGLAAVVLVLSACGSGSSEPDGEQEDPGGAGGSSSVGPESCPESLPKAAPGAVEPAPAAQAPDLPTPLQAWRCFYGLAEVEEGSQASGWEREGEPEELGPEDLEVLAGAVDALEPAPADRACTMDLGPRALLVYAHAGEGLIGVQVDGFGCREVRLTADPVSVPAGEAATDGVVPGVLAGDDALIDVAGLRPTGG